jgi:hypothetical protein
MEKEESIREVLRYLNSKLSVNSRAETEKVKKILAADEITLREVVEWYIEYVQRSC